MTDPGYALAALQDNGDPLALIAVLIMGGAIVLVTCATLAAHYMGQENFITRALDRWSK